MYPEEAHTTKLAPARVLDLVWREQPYLPRAIAQLIYSMDSDGAAREYLRHAETELAVEILAERYQVESAFMSIYGISWGTASDIFHRAARYSISSPDAGRESVVIYGPAVRLLYRLGYCDGLARAEVAPAIPGRPPETLSPPKMETEEEEAVVGAALTAITAVLNPAYQAGYDYGAAEVWLREHCPSLLEVLGRQARLILTESPVLASESALMEVVLARELDLPDGGLEQAIRYTEGLWRGIREYRARVAVEGYLRKESRSTRLLDIASAVRALAREVEGGGGGDPGLEDELDEALLLAGGFGLLPVTAAALLKTIPDETVPDIISRHARDYQMARSVRSLLCFLTQPPNGGGILVVPAARVWSPEVPRKPLRLEGGVGVRALVIGARHGFWTSPALSDLHEYHSRLHRLGASEADIAELLVRRIGQAGISSVGDVVEFGRLEVATAAQPRDKSVWAEMEYRLLRRVAAAGAELLLLDWDEYIARRTRAEAQIALEGREERVELAEAWVAMYRAEAAGYGISHAVLEDLYGLSRSARLAEGVLLLARARVIEAALDERAWREVRAEVIRHTPSMGQRVYLAQDVRQVLHDVFRVMNRQVTTAVTLLADRQPRFGARARGFVDPALLEGLVLELDLVDELECAGLR